MKNFLSKLNGFAFPSERYANLDGSVYTQNTLRRLVTIPAVRASALLVAGITGYRMFGYANDYRGLDYVGRTSSEFYIQSIYAFGTGAICSLFFQRGLTIPPNSIIDKKGEWRDIPYLTEEMEYHYYRKARNSLLMGAIAFTFLNGRVNGFGNVNLDLPSYFAVWSLSHIYACWRMSTTNPKRKWTIMSPGAKPPMLD